MGLNFFPVPFRSEQLFQKGKNIWLVAVSLLFNHNPFHPINRSVCECCGRDTIICGKRHSLSYRPLDVVARLAFDVRLLNRGCSGRVKNEFKTHAPSVPFSNDPLYMSQFRSQSALRCIVRFLSPLFSLLLTTITAYLSTKPILAKMFFHRSTTTVTKKPSINVSGM